MSHSHPASGAPTYVEREVGMQLCARHSLQILGAAPSDRVTTCVQVLAPPVSSYRTAAVGEPSNFLGYYLGGKIGESSEIVSRVAGAIMPVFTCRALLLDLDDTLLDHRTAVRRALSTWAEIRGVRGPASEWDAKWFALETEYYRRFQTGEMTLLEQRRARVRSFLPHLALTSDDAADAVFDEYWQEYERHWSTFPDAARLLERALRSSQRVGILTNGDASSQRRKIDATELAQFDLPLFASSALAAAKPSRAAFTACCDELGSEPQQTLMVGDVLDIDIAGAQSAGMQALLLDRDDTHLDIDLPRVRSLDEIQFRLPQSMPVHPSGTSAGHFRPRP